MPVSKTKTILIASEYLVITEAISALLTHDFSIIQEDITSANLFNRLNEADLVLLCCTTNISPQLYIRLKNLNKQLVILTDLEKTAVPINNKTAFISLNDNRKQIVEFLQGFFTKPKNPYPYSHRAAVEIITKNITLSIPENNVKLTKREQEVYSLILINLSTKQIAKKLNVSTRTVRYHIEQLNQKLGFNLRKKLKESVSPQK